MIQWGSVIAFFLGSFVGSLLMIWWLRRRR
jgi:hypothetical protein